MSEPLWRIPGRDALALQGEVRRELIRKQRQEKEASRVAKRKDRARAVALLAQRETERRAREREEWFATHDPPTEQQLEELRRERAPALAAAMEGRKSK